MLIVKVTNFEYDIILSAHLINLTMVGILVIGANKFATTWNYFWIYGK